MIGTYIYIVYNLDLIYQIGGHWPILYTRFAA